MMIGIPPSPTIEVKIGTTAKQMKVDFMVSQSLRLSHSTMEQLKRDTNVVLEEIAPKYLRGDKSQPDPEKYYRAKEVVVGETVYKDVFIRADPAYNFDVVGLPLLYQNKITIDFATRTLTLEPVLEGVYLDRSLHSGLVLDVPTFYAEHPENLKEVIVYDVIRGSPAERYGFLPLDRILQFGETEERALVSNLPSIFGALELPHDSDIKVLVERLKPGGKVETVVIPASR